MPVSTLMRTVPAWDIELMAAFLAVEPAPEERTEHAIAQFIALWAHSKKDKNAEFMQPHNYLQFRKVWDRDAELDSVDLGLMDALHRRAQ